MRVEDVRELTMKGFCKYGGYGSFEHLLFLVINCVHMDACVHFCDIFWWNSHWDFHTQSNGET